MFQVRERHVATMRAHFATVSLSVRSQERLIDWLALSSVLQDIRTLHDCRFTSLGLLAENQEGTQGNSIGLWWETQSNKTDNYTAHYAPVSFQAQNQAAGWGTGALQGTLGNTIPYTPLLG